MCAGTDADATLAFLRKIPPIDKVGFGLCFRISVTALFEWLPFWHFNVKSITAEHSPFPQILQDFYTPNNICKQF